ncbi:MAG: extracellular solute-binding protein, partial [Alphaproteobacteria bacterium]|nr:extracellular solute-binding protein [Alphaproteobacteria bacterium]
MRFLKLSIAGAAMMIAATAANAADKIKFDFWYGNTGAIGDVIAGQCKKFNESQDKYEVNCAGQGGYDKAEQNVISAYRAKQQPVLTQLYDAGTVNFMLSGAVVPAVKFAKDNNINIDWADYYPAISNFFATSKGELWSFPYNNSTALMYYNKDALAKIGKQAPPANLEELTDDLKAMKAAGYDCAYALDFDPWVNLEQFSYISNIPLATKNNGYDGLDAELVFNKGKAVDFAKLAKSWLDNGYAKIQTAQTGKDKVKAFADGSCQFMYTSVGDHATVTNTHADSVHWGVAPLPVFKDSGRVNSAIGGASVWVMAGKSPEEYAGAAEFIKYITAYETGVKYIAANTGYIPVTKSGFKKLS